MKANYDKMLKILIDKKMTKTDLRKKAKISSSTLAKIGKQEIVSSDVLFKISYILNCNVNDIVELIPDESEEFVIRNDPKKLKVISLFSGAGGMDLGFEGGFTCLRKSVPNDSIWIDKVLNEKWVRLKPTRFGLCFANDILHEAQVAWVNYFRNFGYDPSIYRTQSIVDLVKAHYQIGNIFPGEIDVITGGFPCQDFSVAGKRQGFQSQKDHNGNKRDTDEPSEETRGKLYI